MSYRPDRVADQVRAELSELLARHVHDPGFGFVTITRVQMTADLQLARVFYTLLGDAAKRKETAKAFRRAAPFLRREIGRRLRLRRLPELQFRFDDAIEGQARIEELIEQVHAEDAVRAAEPGGGDREARPAEKARDDRRE